MSYLLVKVFKSQYLKVQFMAAAKAYSKDVFWAEMAKIEAEDVKAYEWLIEKDPSHWARAFYRELPKCDMILNNICESFNGTNSIMLARQRPILSMLERIRLYILQRLTKQRVAASKWHGEFGPRISEIVEKNKLLSGKHYARWCGGGEFQVQSMYGSMYAVDIRAGRCSCKRWDLSGKLTMCIDLKT